MEANSIIQINNIVDKILGSTLEAGSLSALSYAGSLNSIVTSILISALSTVLYPIMTEEAAKGNLKRLGELLSENLQSLTFILIPISCIAVISRQNIVSIVFERGSFDSNSTRITAIVLACYAPYYAFSGMREVLNRGFFALQDTKTPMINGAIGVGCNVIFSIIFVRFFGIAGIALGTTLANAIISGLLLYSTHKKIPAVPIKPFVGEKIHSELFINGNSECTMSVVTRIICNTIACETGPKNKIMRALEIKIFKKIRHELLLNISTKKIKWLIVQTHNYEFKACLVKPVIISQHIFVDFCITNYYYTSRFF